MNYTISGRDGRTVLSGENNTAIIHNIDDSNFLEIKITRKDVFGKIYYKPFIYEGIVPKKKKKVIFFIGASIGRDWRLEEISKRQPSLRDIAIVSWAEYKFDKKSVIEHILRYPFKVDMVLIKECATYFPLDEEIAIEQISHWSTSLKKIGMNPVVVTTVPIAHSYVEKHLGAADSVCKYNDLLRHSGLEIFDVALSLSEDTHRACELLSKKFAREDGLHLNERAYFVIDKVLAEFLLRR